MTALAKSSRLSWLPCLLVLVASQRHVSLHVEKLTLRSDAIRKPGSLPMSNPTKVSWYDSTSASEPAAIRS
jgi:hypothetical protein